MADSSKTEINAFWRRGKFNHFSGVNKTRIEFATFEQQENNQCLVIVPGRSESYLKYKEIAYDFFNLGYNLAIIDHRGQGLSGRMTNNRQKGYVDSFSDYVKDLETLINDHIPTYSNKNLFLLAHSMGGCIAASYLDKTSPSPFRAAVLTSPMLGIHASGLPTWLAKVIVNVGSWLNNSLSKQPWYFLSQSDYKKPEFHTNHLTHCKDRFDDFVYLYQEQPELQLGGVTFQWLKESLNQTKYLLNKESEITIPTMVLQASEDTIVDNDAQNLFCQRLNQANPASCPNGSPVVISGAKHEILFETNDKRKLAMEKIVSWYRQFDETSGVQQPLSVDPDE